MYSPFDINEAISHRKDYVEEGLRSGSPVVGITCEAGQLLLTVRRTHRKIYEIYDRQLYSAIGRQSDIENVRLTAIQNAHQEGFERSPDDVSLQRLVGFALSPTLKKAFGDQMYIPIVIKALFAELGRTQAMDCFYVLNYDGEFREYKNAAVIAGTHSAEEKMMDCIGVQDGELSRDAALQLALRAWIKGARDQVKRSNRSDEDDDILNPLREVDEVDADRVFLHDELKTSTVEAALLLRLQNKETRFQLIPEAELKNLISSFE